MEYFSNWNIFVVNEPTSTPNPYAPYTFSLLEKIGQAMQILSLSPELGYREETAKIKTKKGVVKVTRRYREIALVILNRDSGEVFEKRYWLSESEMDEADKLRKKYLDSKGLPNFVPNDSGEEYEVIVNWWNSHNSDLRIQKKGDIVQDRYVVIANKYLKDNDALVYPEDKTGKKLSGIIYVPYSPLIHTAELVAAGLKFLNENTDTAFQSLRELGVKSHAYLDKLAVDTITPTFVKNIFLTEQSDPKLLLNSEDGGKMVAERVLVRLGSNGDKTFRYTFSKTGALGLGQIMPNTYSNPSRFASRRTGVAQIYPEAKLIPDRNIGRADVVNGIKASVLVFDDHFSAVIAKANKKKSYRELFAKLTLDEIDEIRAGIYNGGPSKYSAQKAAISTHINETNDFIAKFKKIRELHLFDPAP
ncbi:MAG: hypothetical protein A3B17_00760 [Candidatus Yanofskybacteria bacterium RIFCSPLOWO2_01_FULL_45_72]|nr:MAG: hypothetical protein A3B17_00760 [Candidatus Yanofskybacteria bacterium RIFCSPLOWO2_01_FULL_45_72]